MPIIFVDGATAPSTNIMGMVSHCGNLYPYPGGDRARARVRETVRGGRAGLLRQPGDHVAGGQGAATNRCGLTRVQQWAPGLQVF